jgi:amino acid transporter
MEDLNTTIQYLLVIALIILPVVLLNKLYKRDSKKVFTIYIITAVTATFILVLILAWWSHFSIEILLSHYGYDADLLTETERLRNVSAENLDRVKTLDTSRMGIGWPLKAILFYIFYSPYLLIVYFGSYFYKKSKLKRQTNGSF